MRGRIYDAVVVYTELAFQVHQARWHYESVIAEVTDYVRSLVESRPPMINSYDCAYAIRVVEASYESIRSTEPVALGASAIAG
jgi:predicted dehydrogenase